MVLMVCWYCVDGDGWIFGGSEMKQEERFQNSLIDDVAVAMT